MTFSKNYAPQTMALLGVSCLAACGGGGGGSDDSPAAAQASIPLFTNDFQAFAGAQSFTTSAREVRTNGATVTLDLTIRAANDGSGDIIITEGGNDFRLSQDPNTGTYLFDNGTVALAAEAALSDHAGLMLIVADQNGVQGGSFHAFGDQIASTVPVTGTAYYIGPSAYVATLSSGGVTSGSGGFVFEANFDTNMVDGVIALQDASGTSFTLDFEDATVGAQGFTADNLRLNGLNATVTASGLQAGFFGDEAEQVAGSFDVDLTDSAGTQALVAGGFLGDKQSPEAVAALASGQPVATSQGEQIVLGSGSLIGSSGSVYPDGSSSYYNSNTGVSFGADGGGCYYVGDWSNC
ncbi:transferrin-binding protein-like solute binding protein [Cognatiyoonia sp. IB215182]|uniref:transferrin-binding protein-like solute binding protein n=1 Tax=Cognatiyoonia sp. IB215182 TaxID=3097353 RepID=UPI002A131A1B|nr:transferrin-binding protein-like solute binding protein [Cognatiyoonia sp. IB215182]MDX8353591.1 transferrin-binding protein-like solute binding protein [Cognatiyoonia sp. IB215182]